MNHSPFVSLLSFLKKLDILKTHYDLSYSVEDSIMVAVAIPGERWEVEFVDDGSIRVEVFRSNGEILEDDALEQLLARCHD